jgi:hypothetical protein
MKLQCSKVTYKSLQQKEVNLPLVPYCANHFGKGLSFRLSATLRWNVNSFMSTQIRHCSENHKQLLTYTACYTPVQSTPNCVALCTQLT